MVKKFFNWLFRIKPKAPVKVDSGIEFPERPSPGEQTLDVTLEHINRMRPMQEYKRKPRETGMPPVMAASYEIVRAPERTREELSADYARNRDREIREREERNIQAIRNHRFRTQYAQPATPQDRTVEDLVMMASAIGMSSAFAEGRSGDDAAMLSIHDANLQRVGVVEAGGDLAAKASEFAACIDRVSSHRETPSESCYTPSRSEPEPSRYEPTPSEPSSSSSNDSYGD